jgi:curved DNA-binding protein
MQYKDYYQILGVPRTATAKEVKAAYRKLSKEYHPDLNKGFEDKFKDLGEAYEVLGDADKRKRYDALGANWKQGGAFNPNPGPRGGGGVSMEDLFGAGFGGGGAGGTGGFSDLFETMFAAQQGGGMGGGRGARGGRRQTQPVPEQLNEEQMLALTLEEVAKGCQRSIRNAYTGQSLTVDVPKGSKPDSKIRLKGQGKVSAQGQQGDLLLKVSYQRHALFELEGLNLTYHAEVSVPDLALGCELHVPTLTQGSITLSIPAGSQPDRKLRLKGLGLPDVKDSLPAGDLYVRLKARLPEALSAGEIALYRQLKALRLQEA